MTGVSASSDSSLCSVLFSKDDLAILLYPLDMRVRSPDMDTAGIGLCAHRRINGDLSSHMIQCNMHPAIPNHLRRSFIICICNTIQ